MFRLKFSVSKASRKRFTFILNLLHELETNAKLSDRQLAKKLNTSQSTVSRTRSFLEHQGIIKGYITLIDKEKIINMFK